LNTYDVIVIGGGPAGLMAAVSAGMQGARTVLLEKGDKLGRKLAISGGGRCNVTNAGEIEFIIKNIPGNGRFLHSVFAQFSNYDIIDFFEGLGIRLKEEDRGRMFPVTDKAKDVVNALIDKVRNEGVEIRPNTPVDKVLYDDGGNAVKGVLLKSGEVLDAPNVIVAVGGKSVPHTGSAGEGYPWAQEGGHTITELYPTEVPLTSNEEFIRNRSLQGLSLRDVKLAVWNPKGKKVIEHEGDMIFTHFGLSGPLALRCSSFVIKVQKQFGVNEVAMTIDLFPAQSVAGVHEELIGLAENESKKAIKNGLKGFIPERLIPLMLEKVGLDADVTFAHVGKNPLLEMAKYLKAFPAQVNGTLSIEEAFVTGGGIHLKEVDPKTMKSKQVHGLFAAGEILDIQGYTGGFNLTAAMCTGYVAGKHAAQNSSLLGL
jgi:predicted Rossmann fold flavoprotein